MKLEGKRLLAALVILVFVFTCSACGSSKQEITEASKKLKISIAHQYGLAYAPLVLCQRNNLIEKAYKELTGNDVKVEWIQMSSGADINTGIASGDLNVGFIGIAPAIIGISKKVGYKIFTNLSGQEHGLMTNDSGINNFDDIIGSSNQIALVNTGSIQHIILAKALVDNGYDAHALDSNLVAMKHPDGMSSLETNSVSCHLTTNPYIYMERANTDLHEIELVKNSWSVENTFIVGVAVESLYIDNPDLYKSLCDAISDAIDSINSDIEGAAKITCEFDGNSYEDEVTFLKAGVYGVKTKGIFEIAQFMYNNQFIESGFNNYHDLVFDNVAGD